MLFLLINMPVTGISLKTIDAEKKKSTIPHGVSVNNKANTVEIKESDLPGIGQKGLIIDFIFETKYTTGENESIADIKIEGNVFYIGDDIKEIMNHWKKKKEIPEDAYVDIINTIFRKCVSKAMVLAEDLQLPPPVGLPFAQKKGKE